MSDHYVPLPVGNPAGTRFTARCLCGRFVSTMATQQDAADAGRAHVAAERLTSALAVNSAPSW